MTIGEVSKKYGIKPDTLRYYERAGLIPYVTKNESGLRDYNEEACRWVRLAQCMRSAGMPIEALAEYVRLFQMGDETLLQRKELLLSTKADLEAKKADLQAAIDRLDMKIENYERKITEFHENGASIPDAEKDI